MINYQHRIAHIHAYHPLRSTAVCLASWIESAGIVAAGRKMHCEISHLQWSASTDCNLMARISRKQAAISIRMWRNAWDLIWS